jgi:hypothetical protein
MEQIGRAMQVQSELLKQMHERQRLLEDVVKDNRRHELVINSAQALNESFQGLQRVQERLADKLEESGGASRGRFALLLLGLVLLAGVGGVVAWRIMLGADSINANLKSALDPRARDKELQSDLAKLEARVRDVEEADRAAFQDEIEKLRKGLGAITAENEQVRRERDGAREELGAAKASLGGAQSELTELRGRSVTLEKDNARLTAQGVADQKTIVQLNDVIAMMKDAKSPAQPQGASAARDGEAAKAAGPPPPADPQPPAPKGDAPARTEPEVAGASTEPLVPFPAAEVEKLNALLKAHRGSDRYELKKVEKSGRGKLWNVLMEVRGPDGVIAKTVEAETLAFWISKDKILDVEFQGGSVTFHQGSQGRSTKSPFFNDRYVIVVLLSEPEAWLTANQPYVKAK